MDFAETCANSAVLRRLCGQDRLRFPFMEHSVGADTGETVVLGYVDQSRALDPIRLV